MPKNFYQLQTDLHTENKNLAHCITNEAAYYARANTVINIMSAVGCDTKLLNLLDILDNYHRDSYEHTLRVTLYTVEMLYMLTVKDLNMYQMYIYGALLHDVGKAKIPLQILDKAGKLTPQEMALMRTHTMYSVGMASGYNQGILDIIAAHSQSPLGGGYPNPAPLTDMNLQLVGVCDRFDALTSKRVYKPRMGVKKSIGIIAGDGFDITYIDLLNNNYQ